MLQLSSAVLAHRSEEVTREHEKMISNIQDIQSIVLKQEKHIVTKSDKKMRRNSITGSLKPQHRSSSLEYRKSNTFSPREQSLDPSPQFPPRPPVSPAPVMAPPLPPPPAGNKETSDVGIVGPAESAAAAKPSPLDPSSAQRSRGPQLRPSLVAKFGGGPATNHSKTAIQADATKTPQPPPPPASNNISSDVENRRVSFAQPQKSLVSQLFGDDGFS